MLTLKPYNYACLLVPASTFWMKSYYFRCDRVDASFTRKCSIEASDSISVLFSFPLHSHCHVILIYIYVVMRSFDVLLPCSSRTWLICFQSRCQLENKKSSFFTICSSLHSESKSYKTVQYLECMQIHERVIAPQH